MMVLFKLLKVSRAVLARRSGDDEYCGCGISYIWATSPNDPLQEACAWHDAAYMKGSDEQQRFTRSVVDKTFLDKMLNIASDDWKLRARAYLYYGIVRLFGSTFWEGDK